MRRLPNEIDRLPADLRIAAEIEALDPQVRQVLTLRLLEKLSPVETAGALRMTVRQVERTLNAALDRISSHVAQGRRTMRRAA